MWQIQFYSDKKFQEISEGVYSGGSFHGGYWEKQFNVTRFDQSEEYPDM